MRMPVRSAKTTPISNWPNSAWMVESASAVGMDEVVNTGTPKNEREPPGPVAKSAAVFPAPDADVPDVLRFMPLKDCALPVRH